MKRCKEEKELVVFEAFLAIQGMCELVTAF